MKKILIIALLSVMPLLSVAAPNPADVSAVAGTPALLGDKIDGMNDADAADFTKAAIDAIEANGDLSDAEKEALVLDIVTRYTVLAGDNAATRLGELVKRLGAYDRMGLVTAAAMIASGDNASAVKDAILANIADADTLADATAAAGDPSAALGGTSSGDEGGTHLSALRSLLATIGAAGAAAETYEGQE